MGGGRVDKGKSVKIPIVKTADSLHRGQFIARKNAIWTADGHQKGAVSWLRSVHSATLSGQVPDVREQ